MELLVFAVYDAKAEFFGNPIFQRSVGEALRAFSDEAVRDGSMVAAHPLDYSLYQIGKYDQATGRMTPCEPIGYGTANEFVHPKLELQADES